MGRRTSERPRHELADHNGLELAQNETVTLRLHHHNIHAGGRPQHRYFVVDENGTEVAGPFWSRAEADAGLAAAERKIERPPDPPGRST